MVITRLGLGGYLALAGGQSPSRSRPMNARRHLPLLASLVAIVGTSCTPAARGPEAAPSPAVAAPAPVAAAPRDPRVGDPPHIFTPAEKVEKSLNGTWEFPPSPQVPWKADETGFAKERLFTVPAPGIHPRILFAPEDLPRIRARVGQTVAGKAMLEAIKANLAKGIGTPTTWEGQCWAALVANDLDAFKAAYKEHPLDNVPPGSGFKKMAGRDPVTKWGVRNPLLASLMNQALVALIEDDAETGRKVGAAYATYARFVAPKVAAANATPQGPYHWDSTRDLVPNEIAYGYDWAWPWMTAEQRAAVQKLIVDATAGKYTLAMDLPQHWRRWNFIGMTESYAACCFAIEGEPGSDPRGLERLYEVYRDYLTYGSTAQGVGTEGIDYHTIGVGHIVAPMIAYANRGKNLLTHPHFRAISEQWLVQALQPFGGAWQAGGDLGNFPPNPWLVGPQKYFYPASPSIDLIYRQHPNVQKQAWDRIVLDGSEATLLTAEDPAPADTRAAAVANRPLTFEDTTRGVLYTRTGWGTEDAVLHVECRVDTAFPSHDHPDRGNFTFSALGRAWACDGYRDTEGKYHNLVSIDGRGQGYFPPAGRWIATVDTPQATFAVTDAKYAWDWMWAKSMFLESKASLIKRNQAWGVDPAERLQARFPLEKWEADPSPVVKAYNEGFTAVGDPRMWNNEDGWVLRTPHYPVNRAFRTTGLVRGAHPYVLVIDDIKKDDAEHLYEWRMNAGPDVEAVSIDGSDILLGDQTTNRVPVELDKAFQGKSGLSPKKGDRLLLVRTLEIGVPDLPTLQGIPQVAAIEYKKTDDSHQFSGRSLGMGTQVILPSRTREPKFKVLLVPHRQGEELPVTTWNDARTEVTIAWKDQRDVIRFATTTEGRTTLVATRNGQPLIEVP